MDRGLRQRAARLLTLALVAVALGCEDQSYRPKGVEINVIVRSKDDARIAAAQARLVKWGASALPQIETALHAAPEAGRLRLVTALTAMDQPESIPILRHLAAYDPAPDVRAACEATLKAWAARPAEAGAPARAALTRVAQLRE